MPRIRVEDNTMRGGDLVVAQERQPVVRGNGGQGGNNGNGYNGNGSELALRRNESPFVVAVKKYVRGHYDAIGTGVKVGVGRTVGLLPDTETLEGAAGHKGIRGKVSQAIYGGQESRDRRYAIMHEHLLEHVLDVIDTADAARQNADEMIAKGQQFVGNDKVRELRTLMDAAQHTRGPVRIQETELATQLASEMSAGLVGDERVWVQRKLEGAFNSMFKSVGEKLVTREEYKQLSTILRNPSAIFGAPVPIIETSLGEATVAASLGAREGFNPAMVFNRKQGMRVVVDTTGAVVMEVGNQPDTITSNVNNLGIDMSIPDNIEAMASAMDGKLGGPKVQKLVTKLAGGDRAGLPDVATLSFQREGAQEKIKMPVISATRAKALINRFFHAIDTANSRVGQLKNEPDLGVSVPLLQRNSISQVEKGVLELPREDVVIQEAQMVVRRISALENEERQLLRSVGISFDMSRRAAEDFFAASEERRQQIKTSIAARVGNNQDRTDRIWGIVQKRMRHALK